MIKRLKRAVRAFWLEDSPRYSKSHVVLLDTKRLTRFLSKDKYLSRYFDSLDKANAGKRNNFFKQCRFICLQELCRHVLENGIVGDFAECGCFQGHSTHIIASMLQEADNGNNRALCVFDSFEGGLSERGEKDKSLLKDRTPTEQEAERANFASSESQVTKLLSPFPFVKIFKGWIPERFEEASERKFAFAHLDVDLYQPTMDSLEFFYARMPAGGVFVIDDYGYSNFTGAQTAVDEFRNTHPFAFFFSPPTGGAFLIK